jgi:hypothetical protein
MIETKESRAFREQSEAPERAERANRYAEKMVTNTENVVTNKRTGNRHDKDKQREYMRNYMRKKRNETKV